MLVKCYSKDITLIVLRVHLPANSQLLQMQGAIIVASLFEVLIGVTGLIGLLLRYIGPLTVAPVVTLIGLSLFDAAVVFAAKNWYIALA